MNDIVVVSAIIGNYDTIKPIPVIENIDYILFTDGDINTAVSCGWSPVAVTRSDRHPRMQAKEYKLLTHKFLKKHYSQIIWIDGSVVFKSTDSFASFIEDSVNVNLKFFKHPIRNCIYQEAIVSCDMAKYKNIGIEEQIRQYRFANHPEGYGLWASGVFSRSNDININNFFEFWMYENQKYTYQDQLSLPIALRKFNIIPEIYSQELWDNDWFYLEGHRNEL